MSKIQEQLTLADVCVNIVDCEHKTAPTVENSQYISIRTTNISRGKLDLETANRVSEETYKVWTRRMVPEEGDIIIAREAPVGEVGIVPCGAKVCLGQRTVLLRPNPKIIVPHYLLYLLVNPSTRDELISMSTGSVVEHLNVKDLRSFKLPTLPTLDEQRRIGETLSAIDDKIDLVHQQNRTLEQMAETMYRQWFVEEESDNWESSTIGEYVTTKGGGTPSTSELSFWDGNVNWTSPRDLSGSKSVFMLDTSRKITNKGLEKISSGLLPPGTVLLSSRAPIGYLAITDIPVAINQGYIACVCDKGLSPWFVYSWLKSNMDLIISSANGSTFLEIPKGTFRLLPFAVPPQEKLERFDNVVTPMFEKIKANEKHIKVLKHLRDTLLPKLMSGEVITKTTVHVKEKQKDMVV